VLLMQVYSPSCREKGSSRGTHMQEVVKSEKHALF
jgi:hypothetical protein